VNLKIQINNRSVLLGVAPDFDGVVSSSLVEKVQLIPAQNAEVPQGVC